MGGAEEPTKGDKYLADLPPVTDQDAELIGNALKREYTYHL